MQDDGRYSDQAMQATFADGLVVAEQGGSAVAEWRRAKIRSAQTCNRVPHRPRKPSGLRAEGWRRETAAPEGNLAIVERGGDAARRRFTTYREGCDGILRVLTGNTHTQ